MKIYNTASKKIEKALPQQDNTFTIYSCGPTVYDYTHIGHLRTYCSVDWLKSALEIEGYKTKHVMNITDVGHLTGDSDAGEDKLEKGAKRQGKSVWDIASYYTKHFFESTDAMQISHPDISCSATDNIDAMIDLIKILEKKGHTYQTKEGIYFDISTFPNYDRLSGQDIKDKKIAAREEINVDHDKKNPADFALWFFTKGRFQDHIMRWPSPWGEGFPGWHIECSAMSLKYLGDTIDIHTGGIDHIPVHHTNEIAQSESATGKKFVKYWFHCQFMTVGGEKMSKSLGNIYTLADLQKKGFSPLDLKYLFLQTHYRQQLNFTFDSLASAASAYKKLKAIYHKLEKSKESEELSEDPRAKDFEKRLKIAISDDVNLPQATAVIWEMLKSEIDKGYKFRILQIFNNFSRLSLDTQIAESKIPERIEDLANKRQEARDNKDFQLSDKLRSEIESRGYLIEDLENNYRIIKK